MNKTGRYRYPGINSFTSEDADIFCGRSDDAQRLLNRIMLNPTTVLHGRSGGGKTSLVQAGLLPLLDTHNLNLQRQGKLGYLPIIIRLDSFTPANNKNRGKNVGRDLVTLTLKAIDDSDQFREAPLPFIDPKPDSLWYKAKQLERQNSTLLLIFDQFEEFQGYPGKTEFTQALSHLFASPMPEDIYQEYDRNSAAHYQDIKSSAKEKEAYNNEIRFLEEPLKVHILFVVREDRLGTMSLLADYFPDILKNDVFLSSLDNASARRAIELPAQIVEGNFQVPAFHFDPAAVDKLITGLDDQNTGFIDPIQLQTVCSSIERKIAPAKRTILASDIPPIVDFIRTFYTEVWKTVNKESKLPDEAFRERRRLMLKKLVVDRKRNLVLENLLIDDKKAAERRMLSTLVSEGLLRTVTSDGNTYFQLSHDRLVPPLLDDLADLKVKARLRKELAARRQKVLGIIAVLVTLLSAMTVFFYFQFANRANLRAQEDKYRLASISIRRAGNPTLSYLIARDYSDRHDTSSAMAAYLHSFDSANYVYLRGIYPSLTDLTDIASISGDSLAMSDAKSVSVWNMATGLLIGKQPNRGGSSQDWSRPWQGSGRLYFSDGDEFISRVNGNGDSLMPLALDDVPQPENMDLSPNQRVLLVEAILVDPATGNIIARLQEGPAGRHSQATAATRRSNDRTASLFITDDTLAVAYANGSILLYKIDLAKQLASAFDTLSVSASGALLPGGRIGLLQYDSTLHYLFAANAQNGIDLFDLRKPHRVDKDADDPRHFPELKGHTGLVNCMALSPNKKYLLTGSSDYTAILWGVETRQRVATLKTQSTAGIQIVKFMGNDSDIVTVSDKNDVFVWKKSRASSLYDRHLLYRFSPFDYAIWGLSRQDNSPAVDTAGTIALYTFTMNYLLSMPSVNEYPDDASYNSGITTAMRDLRSLHDRLITRPDYTRLISPANDAILEKKYYDFLIYGPAQLWERRLKNIPKDPVLTAQREGATWRAYFRDSSTTNGFSLRSRFVVSAHYFFGIIKNDSLGRIFLQTYDDSVLQPLLRLHPGNHNLLQTQVSLETSWLKYDWYTGKLADALPRAQRLDARFPPDSKRRIYTIIHYLVTGQYDDAITLYNKIFTSGPPMSSVSTNLLSTLRELNERGIATQQIRRFMQESGNAAQATRKR